MGISVQRLKSAHRSGRSFLVVRYFKYETQSDHVLEVNGLSRFYVHYLFVLVDKWHIVMAEDAIPRQDSKPIVDAIEDRQIGPVIQIEFHRGPDERPWAIHNDRTKAG